MKLFVHNISIYVAEGILLKGLGDLLSPSSALYHEFRGFEQDCIGTYL
jgi:hypothetical protein